MSVWHNIKDLLQTHPHLRFWWRDDDLTEPTAAGDKILELAHFYQIPVTFAVIPDLAQPSLKPWLDQHHVCYQIAQHGLRHDNNAVKNQKKTELTENTNLEGLLLGKEKLQKLFKEKFYPIIVPPWNRFDPELLPFLKKNYDKISTFGTEIDQAFVNTHIDLIAWRDNKRCLTAEEVYRALEHQLRINPHQRKIGILTHHLVHEDAHNELLEKLIQTLGNERFTDPLENLQ